MKKFLTCIILCTPLLLGLTSCKKNVDYYNYVSENRKSVYLYNDDSVTLKIYSLEKETPYALDGVRGEVSEVTEIYFSTEKTANEVEIEIAGKGGEMSYLAVSRNYYLSFGEEITGASVHAKITVDGKETEYEVLNVAEEGVIDGKTAVKCVTEYDATTFTELTVNGVFNGEIIVRLLYDEGCYYYVGVCNRDRHVHAYLVNGTDGRIIAERESEAEK